MAKPLPSWRVSEASTSQSFYISFKIKNYQDASSHHCTTVAARHLKYGCFRGPKRGRSSGTVVSSKEELEAL